MTTKEPAIQEAPSVSLAVLRIAVAASVQARFGNLGQSLSTGQADLSYLFPRTKLLAATKLAAASLALIYDEKVRSRGVYHLYRLPAFWESRIHQETIALSESLTSEDFSQENEFGFSLLSKILEQSKATPSEGPVDLKTLSLDQSKDLARLVGSYQTLSLIHI